MTRAQLIRDERGQAGASYVALIATVGLVGLAGFTTLGGSMDTAIGGGSAGQGVAVSVAAAAGEAPAPEAGPPPGTTTTTVPVTVSTEAAGGSGGAGEGGAGDLPPGTLDDPEAGGGDGDGDGGGGCGWSPGCHIASATSGAREWLVENVGDIPVLGQAMRFTGGLLDGAWDAAWGVVVGVKEGVESLAWDFLVEDVVFGTGRGLLGTGCKIVTLGQACEDSSWNPIESTTESVANFVRKLPEVRHAVGDFIHEASLCLNPWNGQSSEDRGHACGEATIAVVDIIFAAKGIGKAATASRAAAGAEAAAAGTGALDNVASSVDNGASAADNGASAADNGGSAADDAAHADDGARVDDGAGTADEGAAGGSGNASPTAVAPGPAGIRPAGLAAQEAADAFVGMKKAGGHATRHFADEGLIPSNGSLPSRVAAFQEVVEPILRAPLARTLDTLSGTPVEQYIGRVNGQLVRVDRYLDGDYAGRIATAVVIKPGTSQASGIARALGITEAELFAL